MRKVVTVASAAAVLALALVGSSDPAPRARFGRLPGTGTLPAFTPSGTAASGPVTVSVEMAGMPAAIGTSSDGSLLARRLRIAADQAQLATRVRDLGGSVVYQLHDAADALVVTIDSTKVDALSRIDGVTRVLAAAPVTRASVTSSNTYTGVSTAWQSLGATGKNIKIGVIDDGVDYHHADFGAGTTFPTAKVVGGWDFVGDAFDSSSADPARRTPVPDADPLGCQGHGTHVAGTVAGLGVTADGKPYGGPYTDAAVANLAIPPGAAPEASLYAYKVYGCDGETTDAIVAAAIDRAVADGVDVIMMAIGSAYGAADSLTSVAADNASLAGVTVVAAAGNEGPNAYLVGSPGSADRAISVGAIDGSQATFPGATIGVAPPLSAINANGANFTSLTGTIRVPLLPAADPKAARLISLGCSAADYATVAAGDIVVVRRGQCTRTDKARLAQAAGASAVVLVNTQAGLPPFEGDLLGVTVPLFGVASSAGPELLVAAGKQVTISTAADLANAGYGQAASFSAGGPRLGDSAAKPDVSAPGVSILSAAAGTPAGAVNLSGTSMAAPQVAGIAALARERHPDWTVAQIKAAVMGTADSSATRIANLNTRVSGTGVVDGVRSVDTEVLATTDDGTNALSFGYRPAKGSINATRAFHLENHSAQELTFDLASNFNGGKAADRGAEITITPASVTVPANASSDVQVSIAFAANAMAKLPAASQPAGQVVAVRGLITATPTISAPGVHPVNVPFLIVPRGLSDLGAVLTAPLATATAGTATGSLQLTNLGIHGGTADVYAWLMTDSAERDAPRSSADLAKIGVQTFPGELLASTVADDRAMVFAVSTEGRWSTASSVEIDLPIDVDGNGTTDFIIVGADYGRVLNGVDNGQFASFTFDNAGRIVNVFIADAPMNGSTALLPVLASDLGLNATNAKPFQIRAQSVDRLSGAADVITTAASWDPYHPSVSTADLVDLRGGTDATLAVSVDLAAQAAAPVKGWLIVTLDDRNGPTQADAVAIG